MKYPLALALLSLSLTAAAQYDQNIEVEGEYTPDIIRRERVATFPLPVKFPLEASPLQYALSGVITDFTPRAIAIPATGWKDSRTWNDHRGYLDLQAGWWLDSSLAAGYRIIDSDSSSLGVRFQHNSTSLWKPSGYEWRKWRYDESLGIYGNHSFGSNGRLDAAIDYHIGNFNYYGATYQDALSQTLNDLAANVAWHSDPHQASRLSYYVEGGVRYFGYRSLYHLSDRSHLLYRNLGQRETDLSIAGGFNAPTSAKSSFGLDIDADMLFYATTDDAVRDYSNVAFTPYYRFTRSKLNVKVGARIDLSFNARYADAKHFGIFHIAPQISADYNAGPATLFIHLLGGNSLHTLASEYQLDYYSRPALSATAPVYAPLDGKAGVGFGPFSGFDAGADFAFRISRSQYAGGLYMAQLNSEYMDVAETSNLAGMSVGVHLGYDAGRIFKIKAEGRYQPQKGHTGYFNGYDRPRWTVASNVESTPWQSLTFALGFDWRGQRLYGLKDVMLLNFAASYAITDDITVRLQADNLLNRRIDMLPATPDHGISASVGLSWVF